LRVASGAAEESLECGHHVSVGSQTPPLQG